MGQLGQHCIGKWETYVLEHILKTYLIVFIYQSQWYLHHPDSHLFIHAMILSPL